MRDYDGRVGEGSVSIKGRRQKHPQFYYPEINPVNTCCVALGKALHLSVPQFLIYKME